MSGFVFIPINSSFAIAGAGTGGALILFIVNFFGLLTIVLGLAEMSSMYVCSSSLAAFQRHALTIAIQSSYRRRSVA